MDRISFLIVILISLSCFGQSNDQGLSVTVWTPAKWFSGDKKLLEDNLTNYKFNNEELEKLENEINASKILGIYYKYDPKTHYGLVPTIKLYLQRNSTSNFDKFFSSIRNEIEKVRPQVLDFKYLEAPKIITVGHRKAFYASSTYSLKVQTGETASVRTLFLGVPMNKTYLYVTLIDNNEEDCSEIYKEVIRKIKID